MTQEKALKAAVALMRKRERDETMTREEVAKVAWFMAEAVSIFHRSATRPAARSVIFSLGLDPVAMQFECETELREGETL